METFLTVCFCLIDWNKTFHCFNSNVDSKRAANCKIVSTSGSFPECTHYYRVAGLSCPEAGGCKSAILRGFPNVFSLFGPCKVGGISFRYSWTTGMKKKFRNLILKKGNISGFAQIGIFPLSNIFGFLSISFFKTIQM